MRYAILSDIHANLAAFQAVLDDLKGRGTHVIWCLGDTVGYGPYPNECIELLRSYEHVCVAGNHDWGSTGKIDTSGFNRDAASACHWTGTVLTAENAEYLKDLPELIERDGFTMAHGSPRAPVREYLLTAGRAEENLKYFKTLFCLVGHSHVPLIFEKKEKGVPVHGEPVHLYLQSECKQGEPVFRHLEDGEEITLGEGRFIINPGSVGQPRDGDPRASYAVYDTEAGKMRLYRIPYDIAQTQQRMREEGLPHFLIERLRQGI